MHHLFRFVVLLSCFSLQALSYPPAASLFKGHGVSSGNDDIGINGPVLALNFPDPCIIKVGSTWYAFATNGNDVHIQIATSEDFNTWSLLDGQDALPNPPSWVRIPGSNTWAPDVNQLDDGTFVMYFSASTIAGNGSHCLGAATSDSVEGPYTALDEPLVCPLNDGGAIDSSGFKDWATKGSGWGNGPDQDEDGSGDCWTDPEYWGGGKGGKRYMVYKIDGNSIGHGGPCGNTVSPIVPTPIIIQEVESDGVTLTGSPVTVLNNNGLSDQGIVEAPSLVKTANGKYVLFFSSGCFSGTSYTQNYATADHVFGPYTRQPPLFVTGEMVNGGKNLTGPGGGDIYWDAHHMVFHGDFPTSSTRAMYNALVEVMGTKVIA